MLVALPAAIAFGVTIYSPLGAGLSAQGALAGIDSPDNQRSVVVTRAYARRQHPSHRYSHNQRRSRVSGCPSSDQPRQAQGRADV